jgi:heme A synthase
VALVGFQAWLGRETVRLNNSGESVTAHLAAAMALLGLLVYVLVRSFYPARIEGRGGSQRFTLLAAFTAATTFALLLFGSNVTALNAALMFPDWPLMNGTILPIGPDTAAVARPLYEAHALHRYVAGIVPDIWSRPAAWRTQRSRPVLVAGAGRCLPGPGRDRGSGLTLLRVDADAPPRDQGGDLGLALAIALVAYYGPLGRPAVPTAGRGPMGMRSRLGAHRSGRGRQASDTIRPTSPSPSPGSSSCC